MGKFSFIIILILIFLILLVVRTVLKGMRGNPNPPQNNNLNRQAKKENLDGSKIIDADFEEIK
ncbi:MAG TPA: hypothetical protein VHP32_02565 [Ignavibacteria bacterium]|nr:hypothetical protein [Ignavibacteria bacterium]